MLAYHGRPDLKAAFLEQIGLHEAADRIQHVGYAEFKQNGVAVFTGGCAVGCSLESMRVIEGLSSIEHSDHALYERYLGVPLMLARLEDRIFEGLPIADSLRWPRQFAEAIRPGSDLSMVGPRFLHDLLTAEDGAVQRRAAKHARVKAAVDGVSALFVRWFETGVKPPLADWQQARSAAASASAAADAYAYASAAADARQREFSRQAAALLRLLEAA